MCTKNEIVFKVSMTSEKTNGEVYVFVRRSRCRVIMLMLCSLTRESVVFKTKEKYHLYQMFQVQLDLTYKHNHENTIYKNQQFLHCIFL